MATRTSSSFGIPNGYVLTGKEDIPKSDSVRCYYSDPTVPSRPRYEYTCGKVGGCCDAGCCPTDSIWIGGIIVLVVFVVVLAIVAIVVVVICMQRSRSKEKKEQQQSLDHSYTQSGPPTYYNPPIGHMSPYPPSVYNPGLGYQTDRTAYPTPSEQRYNMFDTASQRRY